MSAAAREMREKGFRCCSVDDVLDSTGVTKGALYYYFPSKQALGLAVLDEVFREETLKDWRTGFESISNPVDALLAILKQQRSKSCVDSVRCGCPLNNLAQEMGSVDEVFRKRIETVFDDWRHLISDALERGKFAGTVRPGLDAGRAATFIISVIEGASSQAKATQNPVCFTSTIETLELFILTIRPGTSLRGS